jgi:NTP pyrophosphatase (non-canonical NTP hydrolase)|tara:strand:+ start:3488 stop:3940 length:453 start_codon:yes stop_codon:yes gene_type:complete
MSNFDDYPLSNFDDVGFFHRKFGLPFSPPAQSIADDERKKLKWIDTKTQIYRITFLQEELDELENAYINKDLTEVADALIDIVYVAMGTAHMHNLPWEELWDEVQQSNLKKERATSVEDSRRMTMLDVVKPKDWQAPRIKSLLRKFGWKS